MQKEKATAGKEVSGQLLAFCNGDTEKKMVSGTGIEPVLPKEADFKSAASAYSATRTPEKQ